VEGKVFKHWREQGVEKVRWAEKQGRAAGSSVAGRGGGAGGLLAAAGGQEGNLTAFSAETAKSMTL